MIFFNYKFIHGDSRSEGVLFLATAAKKAMTHHLPFWLLQKINK